MEESGECSIRAELRSVRKENEETKKENEETKKENEETKKELDKVKKENDKLLATLVSAGIGKFKKSNTSSLPCSDVKMSTHTCVVIV